MRTSDDGERGLWALGCACAKCRRRIALFRDKGEGRGPAETPIRGEFGFACPHCGADNSVNVRELARFRTDGAPTADERAA
ncbi:MAG: hypothetical protein GC206_01370 [Alphaproteobacteria bacterium]|nr:hypothetical protein [Alphaproteobacteria bacterium]